MRDLMTLTDEEVFAVAERRNWQLVRMTKIDGAAHRIWNGPIAGLSSLYVVLDPTLMPDGFRHVVYARHIAQFTGACPICGERVRMPNRKERRKGRGKLTHWAIEHEDDCPVTDDNARRMAQASFTG